MFCARGGGGGGEERGGARFFLLVFWCLFTSSSTSSSGKARSCRSEGFAVGQRSVRVGSVACGWAVECGSSSKQCSDYRASVEKCSLVCVRNGWGSRAGGGDRGFPGVRGMVAWLGGAVWCEGGCGRLLGGGGRACTAVTGVCLFFCGLAAPFGGAAAGRFWGAGAHKGRGG